MSRSGDRRTCSGRAPVVAALVLAMTAASAPAWADGGIFIREVDRETIDGGSQAAAARDGLVSSDGQRAVIWLGDDGCWDMILDPGTVDLDGAAWIVPMPAVPEVSEASPALMDQLDAATMPILVRHEETVVSTYTTSSSGGSSGGFLGCGGMDYAAEGGRDGGGTNSVEDGGTVEDAPAVRVYGDGRIGALTYEIVSSDDPEALADWLEANGYVVPAEMLEPIAAYVEEGYVFFASHVLRTVSTVRRLPVVRFTLCGPRPWYPIRLSTVSVAEALGFTLWVVVPAGRSMYTPTNCSWERVSSVMPELRYSQQWDPYGMEEEGEWPPPEDFGAFYDEQLTGILEGDLGRAMALEMATALDQAAVSRRVDLLGDAASTVGLSGGSSSWSAELQTIVDGGMQVMRYVGRFPLAVMGADIEFQADVVPEETGVHQMHVTYYEERRASSEGSTEAEDADPVFSGMECAVSSGARPGRTGRSAAVAIVLGALVVVAIRRLRRR